MNLNSFNFSRRYMSHIFITIARRVGKEPDLIASNATRSFSFDQTEHSKEKLHRNTLMMYLSQNYFLEIKGYKNQYYFIYLAAQIYILIQKQEY